MTSDLRPDAAPPRLGSPAEVFTAFLRLGLTAFGGPIAHLGYFRAELVLRRGWIDEASYGDLVSLCQFLPGPASSQVGFALGVLRGGGILGGLAAWAGFTLPSAALLFLCALGAGAARGPVAAGLVQGLKLAAVAIVAQAVWGMARSLAPDRQRAGIALAGLALTLLGGVAGAPLLCILLGGVLGLWLCRGTTAADAVSLHFPVTPAAGLSALALFLLLFLLSLLPGEALSSWTLFSVFYHAGALVFGGGHVVLPLLQQALVPRGWIGNSDFLAGYGLTQAVPGPLFTFAAYLGAVIAPIGAKLPMALIALLGLFLPGLLLLYGTLPFWDRLRRHPRARAAMAGANAAVVGILGAALYTPIWTSTIARPIDFVLATAGFLLLTLWRIAPWALVLLFALSGLARALMPSL